MSREWIVAFWAAIFCTGLLSAEEDKPCSASSCYPATGNLLIGREHRLHASSTCGLQGRQRYCIVSHLAERTKCFYCDSRTEWKAHREPYRNSHRIENIVSSPYDDRTRNWWQSENGVQNVTVQIDFEAEFHFTHLVATFKSFRPYGMIIERSSDYGKTWKTYRYFAFDCEKIFPEIPMGPPKKHSDVICTTKYSGMSPSTGGEVIYKVISPHIHTDNPYAEEITQLLMITNLRINFTKLHTLGDDLLDYRPEIEEKYYYALYDLVVRGSCSCYGHAQRCIPIDGVTDIENPDMVHGRCECTHNTQGLNCEKCMDFFNDAPWRPAVVNETNECRRCNCNGHASRCHF
uniref:Laminin N-terminal domain-containing protein n=1 Tax=Steinernema glaseri TaxID=37863 RepID=A0A1I7ZMI1_9BILA